MHTVNQRAGMTVVDDKGRRLPIPTLRTVHTNSYGDSMSFPFADDAKWVDISYAPSGTFAAEMAEFDVNPRGGGWAFAPMKFRITLPAHRSPHSVVDESQRAVVARRLAVERPPARGQPSSKSRGPPPRKTGKFVTAIRSTRSAASSALITLALEAEDVAALGGLELRDRLRGRLVDDRRPLPRRLVEGGGEHHLVGVDEPLREGLVAGFGTLHADDGGPGAEEALGVDPPEQCLVAGSQRLVRWSRTTW